MLDQGRYFFSDTYDIYATYDPLTDGKVVAFELVDKVGMRVACLSGEMGRIFLSAVEKTVTRDSSHADDEKFFSDIFASGVPLSSMDRLQ